MNRATGELNMTVVIVIAVGILSTFFFGVLWPNIRGTLIASTKCSDAICDKKTLDSYGLVSCRYKKDNTEFKCPYKG